MGLAMNKLIHIIHINLQLKRYTGALAGLGWREADWGLRTRQGASASGLGGETEAVEKCSYSSQHDIEVKFDVLVDDQDLDTIR